MGTGQVCTKGKFCTTVNKTNKKIVKNYRSRVRMRGKNDSKIIKIIENKLE